MNRLLFSLVLAAAVPVAALQAQQPATPAAAPLPPRKPPPRNSPRLGRRTRLRIPLLSSASA